MILSSKCSAINKNCMRTAANFTVARVRMLVCYMKRNSRGWYRPQCAYDLFHRFCLVITWHIDVCIYTIHLCMRRF